MSKPDERTPRDPGAYIGHEPELAADRIPGGVRPEDDRVAAYASERDPAGHAGDSPSGHRESDAAAPERPEGDRDR